MHTWEHITSWNGSNSNSNPIVIYTCSKCNLGVWISFFAANPNFATGFARTMEYHVIEKIIRKSKWGSLLDQTTHGPIIRIIAGFKPDPLDRDVRKFKIKPIYVNYYYETCVDT